MALFTREELSHYAQDPDLTYDEAQIVERVVAGWLAHVGISIPSGDPVPAAVFSWSLELGAIANENPAALASRSVDGITDTYSRGQVDVILARARESALSTTPSATGPVGSFPAPEPYPDPASSARWP